MSLIIWVGSVLECVAVWGVKQCLNTSTTLVQLGVNGVGFNTEKYLIVSMGYKLDVL